MVFAALLIGGMTLSACAKTDGEQYKGLTTTDALGLRTCTSYEECGSGRYCKKADMADVAEAGLCSADCDMDKDCYYMDPEASAAWEAQKAEGVAFEDAELPPLSVHCSDCGRCVDKSVISDPACGPVSNIACREDETCQSQLRTDSLCHPGLSICTLPCEQASDCADLAGLTGFSYSCGEYAGKNICQETWRETVRCDSDAVCTKYLGEGFMCNTDGVCAYGCQTPWVFMPEETRQAAEDQCSTKLGEGYFCMEDGERNVCQKWCIDDSSCAYWGYAWKCVLPEGADPAFNFFSHAENTRYGRCAPREDGIDYGSDLDPEKEDSYKFVGVYAAINDSTFTNCGFPLVNCQDSVNIHHLLFKIYQGKDGEGDDTIVFDGKYCHHEMANFAPDPENRTKDETDFQNYAWMVVPKRYTLHVHFHHWNLPLSDIARIENSSPEFWTDWYPEVRGALFEEGKDPGFYPPRDYPMPTHKECENTSEPPACLQWDQDRDGKMGVTTQMAGVLQGEVYNDNRAFQRARMRVVKLDAQGRVNKLQGLLQTDNESHVLGATKSSFIIDPTPNYYKDWERSYVRLVRAPDNMTCKDIEAWGVDVENCGGDINARVVDPDKDTTYICHTPTVNGASENPGPIVQPPEPEEH